MLEQLTSLKYSGDIDSIIFKAMLEAKTKIMDPNFYHNYKQKVNKKNISGHNPILADLISETIFLKSITHQGLSGTLFSEETGVNNFGNKNSKNKIAVLLDPLDGSKNYQASFQIGCIPVAYGAFRENLEVKFLNRSLILNLYADEFFFAVKNKVAWDSSTQLKSSVTKEKPKLHYYTYKEHEKMFFNSYKSSFSPLSLGSVAWEIAQVARSNNAIFVDIRNKAKLHDFLAACILLETLGGHFQILGVSNIDTYKLDNFTKPICVIASNNKTVFEEFKRDLKKKLHIMF